MGIHNQAPLNEARAILVGVDRKLQDSDATQMEIARLSVEVEKAIKKIDQETKSWEQIISLGDYVLIIKRSGDRPSEGGKF